jgi:hypothetical protein
MPRSAEFDAIGRAVSAACRARARIARIVSACPTVLPLAHLGRGKAMSVGHNRNPAWERALAAFFAGNQDQVSKSPTSLSGDFHLEPGRLASR